MRYERVCVCVSGLFSLSTGYLLKFNAAFQAEVSLFNCSYFVPASVRGLCFCFRESHLMITAHRIREHGALRIILTENHHPVCLAVHCLSRCVVMFEVWLSSGPRREQKNSIFTCRSDLISLSIRNEQNAFRRWTCFLVHCTRPLFLSRCHCPPKSEIILFF